MTWFLCISGTATTVLHALLKKGALACRLQKATLFQLLTVTSRAALPHTPQSTLTSASCSTSSLGRPSDPISLRWLRSSVMTRTAPAWAPARRIMVARKRPSNCSTLASVDRLVVISDSTFSAGTLTLPESVGVCWISGWTLSFIGRPFCSGYPA